MGIVAHYHEDDYGMREVLPIEFWPFCAVQMDTPQADAAQKLSASDPLWEEVYRVMEKPQDLSALVIPRERLVATLGAYLPRYERVETGTFSYSVPAERHEGFGFGPYISLFFDYDEKEFVQHIWLVRGATTVVERTAFVDALGALSAFGSFLFVDRLRDELMRTDDRSALMRYFSRAGGDKAENAN